MTKLLLVGSKREKKTRLKPLSGSLTLTSIPSGILIKMNELADFILRNGGNVTRTSVPGVAPIHFPPCSRLLPIPGRLRAHAYAIPILADRTLPLPLLVVLSLITLPSPLYYICSPDPWLTLLCPSHSTSTNLIISRALYLTVGS
jgi:hypothetical protein